MPVTQLYVAAGIMGDVGIVSDKDDGPAFGVELLEEDQYLKGRSRVKVARGLIGQDDCGIVD